MILNVTIPKYRKVEYENGKSFTVYCIEVNVSGRYHSVERRYTEFEELHKQLKHKLVTPEFPPKKILKWQPRVLEQRRQGLETYIMGIVDRNRIPRSLLLFLEIRINGRAESIDSLDLLERDTRISHQPVVAFAEDTFLLDDSRGVLPDIVVSGVVHGLYGSLDDCR